MKSYVLPLLAVVLGYFGARVISINQERQKPKEVPVKSGGSEVGATKRTSIQTNGGESEDFARRLREVEEKPGRWHEGREFFREWFRVDPDAAFEAMKTSPKANDAGGRHYLLCFLFEEEADPDALQAMGERLDEIISVGSWHETGFGGDIYREFNFAVGPSLVERVESLSESYMKEDLWRYAMAGWVYKDWQGARNWLEGLQGNERRRAEVAFFSEGIPRRLNDEVELAWVAGVLETEGNRDLLVKYGVSLVSGMARENPGEALEWAGDHLGGMALAKAVSGVVSATFGRDPDESERIIDHLPAGGVREQAARAFVESKTRKDGLGAFEKAWAEERGGMKMGIQLWYRVGRSLGQQNPTEARRVLAETEGALNRGFLSEASSAAFWKEPEATKQWAEGLEGEKRDEMIELVYRAWAARERGEAEAWRNSVKGRDEE